MLKLNKKFLTLIVAASISCTSLLAVTANAATDYWQNWSDGGGTVNATN